jgi:hypothetical protein
VALIAAYAVYLSQPGMGAVNGAWVPGEFGRLIDALMSQAFAALTASPGGYLLDQTGERYTVLRQPVNYELHNVN